MLDRLLEEVPPGAERADVLFALASTFAGDTALVLALCDEALAGGRRRRRPLGADSGPPSLDRTLCGRMCRRRSPTPERRSRRPSGSVIPLLIAAVIARLAQAEMWAADITPGLLERGVEIEEQLGLVLDYSESPRLVSRQAADAEGELDRARVLLEELETSAAARGNEDTRRERSGT